MRVLVVSAPLIGHVAPLLPLAAALRDAGHEVLVATAADGLRAVRPGLPARDVAPAFDFGRIARRVLLRHPLTARAELAAPPAPGARGCSSAPSTTSSPTGWSPSPGSGDPTWWSTSRSRWPAPSPPRCSACPPYARRTPSSTAASWPGRPWRAGPGAAPARPDRAAAAGRRDRRRPAQRAASGRLADALRHRGGRRAAGLAARAGGAAPGAGQPQHRRRPRQRRTDAGRRGRRRPGRRRVRAGPPGGAAGPSGAARQRAYGRLDPGPRGPAGERGAGPPRRRGQRPERADRRGAASWPPSGRATGGTTPNWSPRAGPASPPAPATSPPTP